MKFEVDVTKPIFQIGELVVLCLGKGWPKQPVVGQIAEMKTEAKFVFNRLEDQKAEIPSESEQVIVWICDVAVIRLKEPWQHDNWQRPEQVLIRLSDLQAEIAELGYEAVARKYHFWVDTFQRNLEAYAALYQPAHT